MTQLTIGQFEECKTCSKKLGSPVLCKPCLHNRATINSLNEEIYKQAKIINLAKEILKF